MLSYIDFMQRVNGTIIHCKTDIREDKKKLKEMGFVWDFSLKLWTFQYKFTEDHYSYICRMVYPIPDYDGDIVGWINSVKFTHRDGTLITYY